jgi:hypothetical protein
MSAEGLTEAEIKLLEKYNKQKEAHKRHQQDKKRSNKTQTNIKKNIINT